MPTTPFSARSREAFSPCFRTYSSNPYRTSATVKTMARSVKRTIPAMSMIRSTRGVSVRTRKAACTIPRKASGIPVRWIRSTRKLPHADEVVSDHALRRRRTRASTTHTARMPPTMIARQMRYSEIRLW